MALGLLFFAAKYLLCLICDYFFIQTYKVLSLFILFVYLPIFHHLTALSWRRSRHERSFSLAIYSAFRVIFAISGIRKWIISLNPSFGDSNYWLHPLNVTSTLLQVLCFDLVFYMVFEIIIKDVNREMLIRETVYVFNHLRDS